MGTNTSEVAPEEQHIELLRRRKIRLVSCKRARKLRNRGTFVLWSMYLNCHVWFSEDLRQPK